MKRFAYSSFLVIGLSAVMSLLTLKAYGKNNIDSLLNVLDQTLEKKTIYSEMREERINNIRKISYYSKQSPEERYLINSMLCEQYDSYICDSVIACLNRNLEIATNSGDIKQINATKLKLSYILVTSGMLFEANEILTTVNPKSLDPEISYDYYLTYCKLYDELYFYTQNGKNLLYRDKSTQYLDSLKNFIVRGSDEYYANTEKEFLDQRQADNALTINDHRLSKAELGTSEYALIAFERSLIFDAKKEGDERLKWLILSAISDVMSATKDNASLLLVANIVFDKGDVDRATRYVHESMDDALFYNTKLRYSQISNIQPIIDRAYQIKNDRQKSRLWSAFVSILVLSLLLAGSLMLIAKQLKRIKKSEKELKAANKSLNLLNKQLQEDKEEMKRLNRDIVHANHVKEHCIASFLGLCSNYIDKLEKYSRMVHKKVSEGRHRDLLNLTNTITFIEQELNEFYINFDNTFLSIYPDFVKEFNELFDEQDKIQLKKGELLTSELRIFALIRLGVENSAEIARLLRYSINTIYNYRAKIKNKAKKSRKEFEELVKCLCSFKK